MTTQTSNPAIQALEKQLQRKIKAYNEAEQKGKDRDELNSIYRELKDIQYRLMTMSIEKKRS